MDEEAVSPSSSIAGGVSALSSFSTAYGPHLISDLRLHSLLGTSRRKDTSRLYEPLRTDRPEIRLLTIHPPWSGHEHDIIRGTLSHAFLDSWLGAPSYETISYSEGDDEEHEAVSINDKIIPVSVSTAAALRSMRLRTRRRVIWIESLCINQNNSDERARQELLMTEIFARSRGNWRPNDT